MSAAEEVMPSPVCHRCGAAVESDAVRKRRARDQMEAFFHPDCWAQHDKEQQAEINRLREEAHARARAASEARAEEFRVFKIRESVRKISEELPRGAATCGSPEFKARIRSAVLHRFAESYSIERGSAALLGPSGIGKTQALAALARRLIDTAVSTTIGSDPKVGDSRELRAAGNMAWITGHKLVTARRFHPLGEGEAPAIDLAARASLLLLDELGNESREADPIIFEVVDARYAAGLPTIVTTGLTVEQFTTRYGDALWRRLVERGSKIEAK